MNPQHPACKAGTLPLSYTPKERVLPLHHVAPFGTVARSRTWPSLWSVGRDSNPRVRYVVYSHAQSPLCHLRMWGRSVPERWRARPVPYGLFGAVAFVRCYCYRLLPPLTPYDAGGTSGLHGCQESNPVEKFWRLRGRHDSHPYGLKLRKAPLWDALSELQLLNFSWISSKGATALILRLVRVRKHEGA